MKSATLVEPKILRLAYYLVLMRVNEMGCKELAQARDVVVGRRTRQPLSGADPRQADKNPVSGPFVNLPAFHHERHAGHGLDIFGRILGSGDDVGQLPFFDSAEFVFDAQ